MALVNLDKNTPEGSPQGELAKFDPVGVFFKKDYNAPNASTVYYGDPNARYANAEADRVQREAAQRAAQYGTQGGQAQQNLINLGGQANTQGQQAQAGMLGLGQAATSYGQTMQGQQAQSYGQAAADRANQLGIAANLGNFAAQGPGPSQAEIQMRQGLDTSMAQNLALARSGRGAGANASALQAAMGQNANQQQQAINQTAALRAGEAANWRGQQLAAMGAQGQLVGGLNAADIGQAGQQGQQGLGYTGLGANTAQAGYGQGLAGIQTGGQLTTAGGQLGLGYNQLSNNASQFGETQKSNILGAQMGVTSATNQANLQAATAAAGPAAKSDAGLLGGIAGGIGQVFSDLRAKTDVKPASGMADIMGSVPDTSEQSYGPVAPGGGGYQPSLWDRISSYRNAGGSFGSQPSDGSGGRGGAGAGGLMSLIQMISDEKSKEDVRPVSDLGRVFGAAPDLRAAQGYSYRYRDPSQPGAAPGVHYGPMAQALEQTPVGRSVVGEGPGGQKTVDTGRLTMVNTAAISEMQRKLDAMQTLFGDRKAS